VEAAVAAWAEAAVAVVATEAVEAADDATNQAIATGGFRAARLL
jgi:hypothetical protein